MGASRRELFRGRHFRDKIIVLCVRWHLRYPLSYRDLEEMMAERGVMIDHSTIARWVLRYGPVLNQRVRSEMRSPNRSWRVDETYIRVAGRWTYLYRANTIAGYEAMNIIRKGQIRWLPKIDTVGQLSFIERAFGIAA